MVFNSIDEDFQSVSRVKYSVGGIEMAKTPKFERKCVNCGKQQPKNEKESNHNWNVFDCNQKCECGGKFATFIDGVQLGK